MIGLGHLGDDPASQPWTSEEVIAHTTGLDAFIDGHSHSTVPMKEVKDAGGNTVVLTQTGNYLGALGRMTITADGTITTQLLSSDDLAGVTPDADVKAIEDAWIADVDKMLNQFKGYSPHIQVQYVSPVSNPMFYYKYTEIQPSANSLIVVGPNSSVVVDYNDLYIYETNYFTYESEIVGTDAEGQLVSALMRVVSDEPTKFYMVSGHEELVFDDKFQNALSKENVTFENLELYAIDEIPQDAAAVVFDAPISDYSKDDVDKVLAYLERGGKALIIPTWSDQDMSCFEQILGYYGVSLVEGIIIEADRSRYYQTPYDLFPYVEYEEITQTIYDGAVFAPLCRGLSYDADSEDVRYTPFLYTSDESFSRIDVLNAADYNRKEEDIDGPFVIGMEVERPTQSGEISKAVIVATEQMFTSEADNIVPGYNVKLFGSIVASLAEHESSIVIPIKYYEIGNLVFSSKTVTVVLIVLGLWVVVCLVSGLIIWLSRIIK